MHISDMRLVCTLQEMNSPVIVQFSNGGGAAIAGKGVPNKNESATIAGSIAVSTSSVHKCQGAVVTYLAG